MPSYRKPIRRSSIRSTRRRVRAPVRRTRTPIRRTVYRRR